MTVIALKPIKTERNAKAKAARARNVVKHSSRQAIGASAIGMVALALTAVSLTHLSDGIMIVTGSSMAIAWATAIGVDLGFVTLELGQTLSKASTAAKNKGWVDGTTIGLMIMSAAMNAFAFGMHAPNQWMMAAAIVFGISIPALIYAMTRVGAAMWLDR